MPLERGVQIRCPCEKPYAHYAHQDTIKGHLAQDHARKMLKNAQPGPTAPLRAPVAVEESRLQDEPRTQSLPDSNDELQETIEEGSESDSDDDLLPSRGLQAIVSNPDLETSYDDVKFSEYIDQDKKMFLEVTTECALNITESRILAGESEQLANQYIASFNACLAGLGRTRRIPGHDAVVRLLGDITKLPEIRFDCCRNSCCAFTGSYATSKNCPFCTSPRTHQDGIPVKTLDITSTERKLKIAYANAASSEIMQQQKGAGAAVLKDIWDGTHIKYLRSLGYFEDNRDIALSIALDTTAIYNDGTHSVVPIILTNHNLPRHLRFNPLNQMIVGFIPAPHEVKDINSFLNPIVSELKRLERGVPAWDGHRKKEFVLRAHVVMVQGDSLAISKLINHAGLDAYHFCWQCKQIGVHYKGTRCPQTPPPAERLPQPQTKRPPPAVVHPLKLPMRDHVEWMASAHLMDSVGLASADTRALAVQENHGITGMSPLLRLQTIVVPHSFVIDAMDVLFQNILPLFLQCWSGIDPNEQSKQSLHTQLSEEQISAQIIQDSPHNGHKKRRRDHVASGAAAERDTIDFHLAGFDSNNEYHISEESWLQIASDQQRSKSLFSGSAGHSMRPILPHKRHAASTGLHFMLCHSTILLKAHLKEIHFLAWQDFVDVIQKLIQPIPLEELVDYRIRIARFVMHFELHYYRGSPDRLHLCLLQIHSLLHLLDSVEQFGPLDLYWQRPIERLPGIIKHKGRSGSRAVRKLSDACHFLEQFRVLPLLRNKSISSVSAHPLQCSETAAVLGPSYRRTLSDEELNNLAPFLQKYEPSWILPLVVREYLRPRCQNLQHYSRLQCFREIGHVGDFVLRSCSNQEKPVPKANKKDNTLALTKDGSFIKAMFYIELQVKEHKYTLVWADVLTTESVDKHLKLKPAESSPKLRWILAEDVLEPIGVLFCGDDKYLYKARSNHWPESAADSTSSRL